MHLGSLGPTISHNHPVVNFRVDDLAIMIRNASGARREPIDYWDLKPLDADREVRKGRARSDFR
jgi:hypothetical protein